MKPVLNYYNNISDVENRPHFINMSGGRSSAMMALALAHQGALVPSRGDVVLFCNTAAEHPKTYDFAAKVSEELEGLGIPTFWLEFCTVEHQRHPPKGSWARRTWWRLVNREPYDPDANPFGYRSDGFVFEELMSWKMMAPSPMTRFCTQHMKVETSMMCAAEWMWRSEATRGAGNTDGSRKVDAARRAYNYTSRGMGTLDLETATNIFDVAYNQASPFVPSQLWQDYTNADCSVWTLSDREPGTVDVWDNEADNVYAKLLGLRADEPGRVARIFDRILFNRGCDNSKYPPGETLMVPLHDAGIAKPQIMDFWSRKDYDLEAPFWAGNCTFCFMKTQKGVKVGAAEEADHQTVGEDATPLQWWIDAEEKYGRNSRDGTRFFGFLGMDKPTYRQVLAEGGAQPSLTGDFDDIPCDCTD